MNSGIMDLVFALLAGGSLGIFYFFGLWWTVRKLPSSKSPALLSLGSFAVRTAVVLTGFYFIMGGGNGSDCWRAWSGSSWPGWP